MTVKHYTPEEKLIALKWWRTLSINEMKAFEKTHGIIYNKALPSEIAAIHEKEHNKPLPPQVRITIELPRQAMQKIMDDPAAFIAFAKKNGFDITKVRPSFEPETDPDLVWR